MMRRITDIVVPAIVVIRQIVDHQLLIAVGIPLGVVPRPDPDERSLDRYWGPDGNFVLVRRLLSVLPQWPGCPRR